MDDAELEEIERTTEETSGPVGGICSEHGLRITPSPFYQQLVEACETVVAALPVCTYSWDSLHSLSLVPRLSWNANMYRAESLVSFVRT